MPLISQRVGAWALDKLQGAASSLPNWAADGIAEAQLNVGTLSNQTALLLRWGAPSAQGGRSNTTATCSAANVY